MRRSGVATFAPDHLRGTAVFPRPTGMAGLSRRENGDSHLLSEDPGLLGRGRVACGDRQKVAVTVFARESQGEAISVAPRAEGGKQGCEAEACGGANHVAEEAQEDPHGNEGP